jgi:hypothetical protein
MQLEGILGPEDPSAEANKSKVVHSDGGVDHRCMSMFGTVYREVGPKYAAKYSDSAVFDLEYPLVLLQKMNILGYICCGPANLDRFIISGSIEFMVSRNNDLRKRSGKVCLGQQNPRGTRSNVSRENK